MKKNSLIFISAVALFSLVNIGLTLADANFIAAVFNSDMSPRSGAWVTVEDIIGNIITMCPDLTNATGYCKINYQTPFLSGSTWYVAEAWYPNDTTSFSFNSFYTDPYGNGKATICKDINCDVFPPEYSNNVTNPTSPAVYSPTATYQFNITWIDNMDSVDKVILEFDGINHTDATKTGDGNYSKTFTGLSAGLHNYKWYANDTSKNNASTGSLSFTVNQADQTITFGSLSGKTWGNPDFAISVTATSGLTVSFAASGSCSMAGSTNVHITGAGSCTITASQSGNSNYNAAPNVTQNFTINKANATINVNGYTGVYDGNAHGATGSATGVGGVNLSSSLNLGSSFINVPGGTAHWAFTGGTNYNDASGDVTITISKASRTCSLNTDKEWARTYDGTASSTTCSVSAGSIDGTMTFTKNSVSVSTPDTQTNAGSFNYICQWTGGSDYSDCSPQTDTLIIDKATPTGSQSPSPSWTVNYPTQTTVSCSLTNGDSGTTLTLKRDGSTVATGTSPSETITLGYKSGGYSYTCEYPQTQNYNAATLATNTLIVNQNATNPVDIYLSNGVIHKNQNITITYGAQTVANVTALYPNSGTTTLYEDGVPVSNPRTVILPAGLHSYKGNISGNSNYSSNATGSTYYVMVNQAPTYVNLSLNGAENNITLAYTQTLTAIFSTNALTATIYRNNTNVSLENGTAKILGVGYYNYTVVNLGNQNYMVSSKTFFVNITQATSSCSLTGLTNHTYGSSDTPVCSCTGNGTVTLYRNGANKTAWNNTAITQEAGDFTWICNTTGYNYTSASATVIQNISKATPSISVTFYPSSTVTYTYISTVTCSRIIGDSSASLTLYRNGNQVVNPDTGVLPIGVYNYNCTISPTQNYTTTSSVNNYLTVQAPPSLGGGGGGCSFRGCLKI